MIDDNLRKIKKINDALLTLKNDIAVMKNDEKMLLDEKENLILETAQEMVNNGCTASYVDGVRWSVRNNPQSVHVMDEHKIPSIFFKEKVIRSLDKNSLRKALKNGEVIEGAYLNNGGVTLVMKEEEV